MDVLKTLWDDPVWSKVIAAGIVAFIGYAFKGWLSRLGSALKKDFVDHFWFNVVATGCFAIFIVTSAYFQGRWPFNREVPQETQVTKVIIREKSAGELIQHLRNFPPLQRETIIENSYIGKWVQWEGKVYLISSINDPNLKNWIFVSVE